MTQETSDGRQGGAGLTGGQTEGCPGPAGPLGEPRLCRVGTSGAGAAGDRGCGSLAGGGAVRGLRGFGPSLTSGDVRRDPDKLVPGAQLAAFGNGRPGWVLCGVLCLCPFRGGQAGSRVWSRVAAPSVGARRAAALGQAQPRGVAATRRGACPLHRPSPRLCVVGLGLPATQRSWPGPGRQGGPGPWSPCPWKRAALPVLSLLSWPWHRGPVAKACPLQARVFLGVHLRLDGRGPGS